MGPGLVEKRPESWSWPFRGLTLGQPPSSPMTLVSHLRNKGEEKVLAKDPISSLLTGSPVGYRYLSLRSA